MTKQRQKLMLQNWPSETFLEPLATKMFVGTVILMVAHSFNVLSVISLTVDFHSTSVTQLECID